MWLIRMIICKKPVPPINHLQEAGQSGHSFARGPAHFFNCLIQSNDLEGWFCGPQIHCITCRAPVTTRCFGCFLSLMTGATLKCKQFSCDLADEKVKNWGPPNVPPSLTEFETLEGAIKERCRHIVAHFFLISTIFIFIFRSLIILYADTGLER